MYETLMHQWHDEVWNQGKVETVYRFMTAESVIHHADESGKDIRGPEEFLVFFHRLRGAFPDQRVTVDEVIGSGDKMACRITVTATHTGDHLGFAATGRTIRIPGMSVAHLRDGKLVEAWNMWDVFAMMQQLGILARAAGEAS
jgi:steroid delta-isomerase-like uncharacterized protein